MNTVPKFKRDHILQMWLYRVIFAYRKYYKENIWFPGRIRKRDYFHKKISSVSLKYQSLLITPKLKYTSQHRGRLEGAHITHRAIGASQPLLSCSSILAYGIFPTKFFLIKSGGNLPSDLSAVHFSNKTYILNFSKDSTSILHIYTHKKGQISYLVIKGSLFNKWCWDNWIFTCKWMKPNPSLTPLMKS